MKTPTTALAAITSVLMTLAASTTPATACTVSHWTKTGGNSLIGIIKGRDCGGNYSARFIGFGLDSGWVPMYKNGANSYMAQFGNGQAITHMTMNTSGATMSVHQKTSNTSGTYSDQASFHLTSMQ